MALFYSCPICLRADLGEITADLLRGVSQRKVAKKYGLWRSAVQRHLAHLRAGPKVSPTARLAIAKAELAVLPTRAELALELRGIIDEIYVVLGRLKAGEVTGATGVKLTLDALRDLVTGVERLGKVSGVLADAPTVNVQGNLEVNVGAVITQLASVLEGRMVALDLAPEARTALLDAFELDGRANSGGIAA